MFKKEGEKKRNLSFAIFIQRSIFYYKSAIIFYSKIKSGIVQN